MRPRFWTPPVLVALIAALAIAAPALAQDGQRVSEELDRTDRRIEHADLLLASTPSSPAAPLIANAKQIQANARAAFGGGQLGVALRLTLQARGAADRALAMLTGLPDPDRVRAQLERTREVIERSRSRIAECDAERARFLIQVADAMQRRAEDAASSERYLAALQLTMSARERALRALRLCNLEENVRDGAERALRRTDDILARAQEAVNAHQDPRAHAALGRAVDLQSEARREFAADRLDSSLRLTQSARDFALRALRLAGGSL